jgi:hypothetical protein
MAESVCNGSLSGIGVFPKKSSEAINAEAAA